MVPAVASAAALDETEVSPSEPVTVILSEKGWVRAAKGHEIDPTTLAYKAGDGFLAAARLRSNQQAIFLDSTGRSYSLPANTLPSARGQGEPLTGKLAPPAGASFVAVLGGEGGQRVVLACDAGYGFITTLDELQAKPKAGKAVLTLPEGARVLPPRPVLNSGSDRLAVIGSAGHLLLFPVSDLPEMPRGKGNKLMAIPKAKPGEAQERVVHLAVVHQGAGLVILASKRRHTLTARDLESYRGERGQRGKLLPRGFQQVDGLESG